MVVVPELAIALVGLLALLVAFGLELTLKYWFTPFVEFLASALSHIPLAGGALAGKVRTAERTVQYWIGTAVLNIERPVVHFFYGLAHLIERLAYTIANLSFSTVKTIEHTTVVRIPKLLRDGRAVTTAAAIAALARVLGAERAALGALERGEASLARRLSRLEAAIAHTGTVAIHELPVPFGSTWRTLRLRLSRLEKLLGAGVLAGLVTAIIARRLPWVRCQNVNNLARHACRLPVKALEDLLAGAVDVLLLSDLCRIVSLMTRGAREAAPAIEAISAGVAELIHCQNVQRPAALPVAWHEPPRVASPLALA